MPKLEGDVAKILAMPGFKPFFLFQCSLTEAIAVCYNRALLPSQNIFKSFSDQRIT